MTLFNKLNDFAKNIGDKTNDAIEVTKLTTKIGTEQALKNELFRKLGEFYYTQFKDEEIPADVAELFEKIKKHDEVIAKAQAEIDQIKAENEKPQEVDVPEVKDELICPMCKSVNPLGTKFCHECGTKLEVVEEVPVDKICPSCGATVSAGTKFCSECGQKMEG